MRDLQKTKGNQKTIQVKFRKISPVKARKLYRSLNKKV